ncbi:MAG: pantoate--beta-alanine ligase [Candidatus Hydrogenedentales bacterium]|jgi:pantoate--beta-alanine ligase
MIVIAHADEMRDWSRRQRNAGKSVGFVPTMGALHEGHASLMRAASAGNDVAAASIFVNPAQFAPHEDFGAYPRTFDADCAMCEASGIGVVYAPQVATVYPEGYATYVTVEALDRGLCSKSRPHFFRGVATVVCKLFNVVEPDRAYFGQKDAQQCVIIKRMARDLDFAVEIVEMPIVREQDGLAMSSRNKYLSSEERIRALCISRGLAKAHALLDAGERDAATIVAAVRAEMQHENIDYVELVDAETLEPLDTVRGTILLAAAANMGKARLIDNIKYKVA